MDFIAPIAIGLSYIGLSSLIPEPYRQRFNAIFVAGAGSAYLSGGGLGLWEVAFVAVASAVAYLGLGSWTFIGVGWLLHTAWDNVHHRHGTNILPDVAHSSLGCAICDPVIALWCFAQAWRASREPSRL